MPPEPSIPAGLPFMNQYVEQILKPHVLRAADAARQRIEDAAWREIIAALAKEQGLDPADPAVRTLRATLEQLGLRLDATLDARFITPAQRPASDELSRLGPNPTPEEVLSTMPDNPLARAVSAIRRPGR